MKRIFMFVLAAFWLLGGCRPAESGMEIQDAWARTAAQGQNGAIYFVIRNSAQEADELTGVSSEVAEAVEVHESRMEGDVMQMHPLHSVPLPANAETAFEPGGLHVMLVGLKQDLRAGEEIEITLHFENFEDVKLRVPVQEAAPDGSH